MTDPTLLPEPEGEDIEVDMTGGIVPEGTYHMQVVSVEKGESKSSGRPMLTWQLAVGTEGEHRGEMLPLYTVTTGAGAFRLAQIVRALGFAPGANGKTLFKAEAAIGRWCSATVKHETFQDNPRASISRISPPGPDLPPEIVSSESPIPF